MTRRLTHSAPQVPDREDLGDHAHAVLEMAAVEDGVLGIAGDGGDPEARAHVGRRRTRYGFPLSGISAPKLAASSAARNGLVSRRNPGATPSISA